jgi:hypothetical protein
VFFAVSHTVGLLSSGTPSSEVAAVKNAMNNVHFRMMGADVTYGGFHRGFGLLLTAYLVFTAFLAWYLGSMAGSNPRTIGPLAWAFLAVQIANLALSWIYFFIAPVIVSALVAVCLGWAALSLGKTESVPAQRGH